MSRREVSLTNFRGEGPVNRTINALLSKLSANTVTVILLDFMTARNETSSEYRDLPYRMVHRSLWPGSFNHPMNDPLFTVLHASLGGFDLHF